MRPHVLVRPGATAAQALLGRDSRLTRQRGQWMDSPWAPRGTATVHPSTILRIPEDADRRRAVERYVDDFRGIERVLNGGS